MHNEISSNDILRAGKEAAAKKVWLKWNHSDRNVKLHISTTKGKVPTDVLLKAKLPHVSLLQLVRTCARYHQEQKKSEERSKNEREIRLRHIASTIAREVEFFWSNIEQVC